MFDELLIEAEIRTPQTVQPEINLAECTMTFVRGRLAEANSEINGNCNGNGNCK